MNYIGFKDRKKDRSILKDGMGRYLTQALFMETCKSDLGYAPLYSMRTGPNKLNLPSARDIYLDSIDEYDAAMRLFGDIEHWNRLTGVNESGEYKCRWFMLGTEEFDGVLSWREELRQRDESLAKAILMEQAQAGNVPAAKALLEMTKSKSAVGRPSNRQSQKDTKAASTLARMREMGVRVHEST